MLPTRGARSGIRSGKYVDEAMELLLAEIARHNTRPAEYQLKLFGGGRMTHHEGDSFNVAARNVETLRRYVRNLGLKVHAESLGGYGYRTLLFDIATGDVWLRKGTVWMGEENV